MSPTLSRPIANSTTATPNPLLRKLSLKKPISVVSTNTTTEEKSAAEPIVEAQNEEPVNPFKKPLSFDKFRETINKEEKEPVENNENVMTENEEVSVENNSTDVNNSVETEIVEEPGVNSETTEIVEQADEAVPAEPDTVETVDNTAEPEVEEKVEEPIVEETPKKKRTRRTKAQIEAEATIGAKENEKTESIACDTVSPVVTEVIETRNNSTVTFTEAMNEFQSFAGDSEWMEYKADIEKTYESINIMPDINSAMLVGIINQLSNLRDRIWNQHQYYKNQYDQLSSKEPEGVIERIKRINVNESANNDMARKKSGIAACMNYKTDNGETINLYDLLDEVRARYYFLNAIMSNIEFKKNLLITISSALKIENSLN